MSQIKDILVIIAILAVVFLAIRLGDITGYVVSTTAVYCQDDDEKATFYYHGKHYEGFDASIFYSGITKGKYSGYNLGGTRNVKATLQDYCTDEGVVEFYCMGNYVVEKEVSCPSGFTCSNGKCA